MRVFYLILVAITMAGGALCGHEVMDIDGFGDSFEQPIQHVIKNLDLFGQIASNNIQLTWQNLEAAKREWDSWESRHQVWMMKRLPLLRLVVILVIRPLERIQKLLKAGHDYDTLTLRFFNRIYNAYKFYRPAFFGQIISNKRFASPENLERMIMAMANVPGSPRVTENLINKAIDDYKEIRKRMREIETYENLYPFITNNKWTESPVFEEYTRLLNSVNRGTVRVLVNDIFQNLDELKTPQGLEQAKKRFIEKIEKRNFYVRNGVIKWTGNLSPEIVNLATAHKTS